MYAFNLSLLLSAVSIIASQPHLAEPTNLLACDSHNPKDLIQVRAERWLEIHDDCIDFDRIDHYPFLGGWYYDEIYYLYFRSVRTVVNHGSIINSGIDECDNYC